MLPKIETIQEGNDVPAPEDPQSHIRPATLQPWMYVEDGEVKSGLPEGVDPGVAEAFLRRSTLMD